MQVGMLFPGQGSQVVGMGADVAAAWPEAQRVFAAADDLLGFGLSKLCFEGPLETLTETRYAQPALLVHSVAVLRVLEAHGVRPAIVAGHSLGEYSALVAGQGLDFAAALRVVQRRGELMFASGLERPGAMAAIIGAAPEVIEAACGEARALGVCDIANRNGPDQIVISGAVDAVEDAMRRIKDKGAKIVKRLNVSGAFHSQLMQEPADELAKTLAEVEVRDARVPVVPNVTAVPETRGEALRALLARQIASPVRWEESMRAFRAVWDGPILEVGPGAVLGGLLKRIDRAAACTSVGDRASLETFLKPLPPGPDGAVG